MKVDMNITYPSNAPAYGDFVGLVDLPEATVFVEAPTEMLALALLLIAAGDGIDRDCLTIINREDIS